MKKPQFGWRNAFRIWDRVARVRVLRFFWALAKSCDVTRKIYSKK